MCETAGREVSGTYAFSDALPAVADEPASGCINRGRDPYDMLRCFITESVATMQALKFVNTDQGILLQRTHGQMHIL